MKVVKIADFYKELKKYPVEWDMVPKSWIREIFNEIQFEIKKTEDGTIISEKERRYNMEEKLKAYCEKED